MYPHERSLVEEWKDKPFALIGINSDPLEKAKTAVVEKNLTWRSFQNEPEGSSQKISTAWQVQGWPTVLVLDANMKICYRGHDGNEATDVARKLLAAMESAGK